LLAAVPRTSASAGVLRTIPGSVPQDLGAISGCAFAPRCPIAVERCATDLPSLDAAPGDATHLAACHLAEATT
jgi:peptide/nickel transport system ATP-binding protein